MCEKLTITTWATLSTLVISNYHYFDAFAENLCEWNIEPIVMYKQLHEYISDNKYVLLMMGLFSLSQLYLHPWYETVLLVKGVKEKVFQRWIK